MIISHFMKNTLICTFLVGILSLWMACSSESYLASVTSECFDAITQPDNITGMTYLNCPSICPGNECAVPETGIEDVPLGNFRIVVGDDRTFDVVLSNQDLDSQMTFTTEGELDAYIHVEEERFSAFATDFVLGASGDMFLDVYVLTGPKVGCSAFRGTWSWVRLWWILYEDETPIYIFDQSKSDVLCVP